MRSLYKSTADREVIARWCRTRLDAWEVPHRRETVGFDGGEAHLTAVGDGPPRVVFVPGTNFNAASSLPVAAALGERWSTIVVDLPGQPGLSSGDRPRGAHRGWYGRILGEILEAVDARELIAVGHSLGAAAVLTCDSDRIAGRALVAPAGLTPLRTEAAMMLRSLIWLLSPTPERTRAVLDAFTAPGVEPPEPIVEWLTLAVRHCRPTLAPPQLRSETVRRWAGTPIVAATGAHDCFLPPDGLAPVVRDLLGIELRVLAGVGHLAVDERPEHIVGLVELVLEQAGDAEAK